MLKWLLTSSPIFFLIIGEETKDLDRLENQNNLLEMETKSLSLSQAVELVSLEKERLLRSDLILLSTLSFPVMSY